MPVNLVPPKTKSFSDDNLIPLINVVFLLLIFFMLAGQIDSSMNYQVSPPELNSLKGAEKPEPVEVEINAQGGLIYQGVIVDQLPSDAIEAFKAEQQDTQRGLVVAVDKELSALALNQHLQSFSENGLKTVQLLIRVVK